MSSQVATLVLVVPVLTLSQEWGGSQSYNSNQIESTFALHKTSLNRSSVGRCERRNPVHVKKMVTVFPTDNSTFSVVRAVTTEASEGKTIVS